MDYDLADKLLDLQSNDIMKPIHASKIQLMRLGLQVSAKYAKLVKVANTSDISNYV